MNSGAPATARRPPPPIPLTILTGFLGSGKTSCLNQLVSNPALSNTLVLINEFGAIGLDHLFIEKVDGDMILMSSGCMETEDFDLAYLSELDPQWNDSELSFIENPEAVLFSNPVARASCALDATTALTKTAIDKLFWCQGSQGSTYPLTGFVAHQASPLQAAVLLVERTDFKLHRFGAIKDSIGEYTPENPAICKPKYSAIMPKSRYRYELVNTIPDAKHCYPFGKSVTTFETGHVNPKDGDNFGFLVWKKRNCCFL